MSQRQNRTEHYQGWVTGARASLNTPSPSHPFKDQHFSTLFSLGHYCDLAEYPRKNVGKDFSLSTSLPSPSQQMHDFRISQMCIVLKVPSSSQLIS